jgi:hypothetical protein
MIARRLVGLLALAALVAVASAQAHGGESEDYVSVLRGVHPAVAGLTLRVVERDEALRIVNHTGKTVLVPGYSGEPYLRIEGDGTIEVNLRSPARYVNTDRYAQTAVPKSASTSAAPRWKRIGDGGAVRWHDHRIHWMSTTIPPKVKDESKRTKIFDWRVPIVVGGQRVAATGTLYWDPAEDAAAASGSSFPTVLAAVGAVVVVALAAGLALWRRRRAVDGSKVKAEAW